MDKVENAVKFNGINSYMVIPDISSIYSFSMIFKQMVHHQTKFYFSSTTGGF